MLTRDELRPRKYVTSVLVGGCSSAAVFQSICLRFEDDARGTTTPMMHLAGLRNVAASVGAAVDSSGSGPKINKTNRTEKSENHAELCVHFSSASCVTMF